uniref:Uncharacterized protein n=1 Tax=Neovison vison TaxID=452646 RepID=A0A8C7BG27_NEOVI
MPATVTQKWTKGARVKRTWGGGWARASRRESQGRVPGCAVNGRERCSLEKSVPSPEEPRPTPQDPAGKQ